MYFAIGEAAKRSGVPIKTIRYYSDLGLLPPAERTEAGYRLYRDGDLARLELIRTLRVLGFDLETIGRLLGSEARPEEAARLQLQAIDLQLRTLRRQRALLAAALRGGEGSVIAGLARARAVAALDRLEREAFLAGHLARAFEGVPVDPVWKSWFMQGAAFDLPDDPTDAQLDAWLELAALVSDESFIASVNAMGREAWTDQRTFDPAAFRELGAIYEEAAAASDSGTDHDSPEGQALIERYVETIAAGARSRDEARQGIVEATDRHDPRAERYWELVAILKGWEPPPQARGHRWLVEGIRKGLGRSDPCS